MKLYISADIEGIAGVVNRPQLGPEGFEYASARKQMTSEVNAAIRGARAAGVTDVVVSDSHGNGQNIILEELEKNVTLVRSWPRALSMMEGVDQDTYMGTFFIGYHAGVNNIGGTLSHTMNSRVITDITLNDIPASETVISAAIAGHFSVPLLMVSGDDVYIEETQGHFPDIETVVTKWSSGMFSARCRQPDDVLTDIEQYAQRAIERKDDGEPFMLNYPVKVAMSIKSRHSAELLDYLPFIKRTGSHHIEFETEDMINFSKIMNFILSYQPNL